MAYVPLNLLMFTSAYSGAMAGMGASDRYPTDPVTAHYSGLATVAGAFAQSFDTQWGAAPSTILDQECAEELCEVVWQDRAPQAVTVNLLPSTYTREVKALIAMILAARAYYAGQGIIPPPNPAGGAGSFTTGSVLFAAADGSITEDNSNLFWNDTNNQLGVGTNTFPAAAIKLYNKGLTQYDKAEAVGVSTGFQGVTIYQSVCIGSQIDSLYDGLGNGGLTTIARAGVAATPPVRQPYVGWGGFDTFGIERTNYFGGGGWGAPDCNAHLFFTAPAYSEVNDTGVLRFQMTSVGALVFFGVGDSVPVPSPSNGQSIFVDPADAALKTVGGAGTITTLGPA